ncbi:MAG TPA: hypothetical protein PLK94_12120, partial [Alphaproteobacteria bacterium]|nr:hypothetical protein [Alphaproteobacteria bacterium]
MKIIPSSMEFKGYEIVKATYTTNDVQTPPETEFKLQPTFSRKIVKSSDEEYQLFLGVTIGGCENDSEIELPFTLEVIVKGTFVPKG